MTIEKLEANSRILIIGGSETTATLLSGVTYLLLTNSEALAKLTQEVRSTFKTEEEITINSVANLTYMLACLDEALRMYPPVANGLPRVVPRGGGSILDRYVPEDVSQTSSMIFYILSQDLQLTISRPSSPSITGLHTITKNTS